VIRITPTVSLSPEELEFSVSRSSGPGGQHANKTSTRVTLSFDVTASPNLTEKQRELIFSRLGSRVSKEGVLSVSAQRHRSQTQNREAALQRLVELLSDALEERPPRRRTRIPPRVRLDVLAEKRRRGQLKRQRAGRVDWEE
jgi:ribosome-associated protein